MIDSFGLFAILASSPMHVSQAARDNWIHAAFWIAAAFWVGIRLHRHLPFQNLIAIAVLGGVGLALPIGMASYFGQLTGPPDIPLLLDMAPIASWLLALFVPQFAVMPSSRHLARFLIQRVRGNRPAGIAGLFLTSGLASIQTLVFIHRWGNDVVTSESPLLSNLILGILLFLGQLGTGLMLVPWFIDKRQAQQSIDPHLAWTSLALLTWNLAM